MIKILVVEDEVIVAKDIQKTLIKMGYDVPATVATATQAFEKMKEIRPNLVMCDIKLKGDIDGIELANRINDLYKVPVIYLTSFVDKQTLDRAKKTQPYGYIVKPFNEADLLSAIEVAIYKHGKDMDVVEKKLMFSGTLNNIVEGVIITNEDSLITFMNPQVELLLNLHIDSLFGKNLNDIIRIDLDGNDKGINVHWLDGAKQFKKAAITTLHTNETYNYSLTVSPILDEKHNQIGKAYLISPTDKASQYVFPRLALDNALVQDSFFIKKGSQLVKVLTDNIFWIQAMDNYVIIQTTNDQFVVHSTMKEIESKLPQAVFARVHRSYIINLTKVQMIDENDVIINEKSIPIGKSYKDSFRSRLSYL